MHERWLHGSPRPLEGLAVYETLRWHGGPSSTWPLHEARWRHGLAVLGWPVRDLGELVQSLALAPTTLWRVRAMAFADGAVQLAWRPLTADEVEPRAWHLRTVGEVAQVPLELRHAKTTHLNAGHAARHVAEALGADEALLTTRAGMWAEATTSNLILGLDDGRTVTPDGAALHGTTLGFLRTHASIPLDPVHPDRLPEVRWAVLTNAVWLVRPVASLDGRELASPPDWIERLKSLLATPM